MRRQDIQLLAVAKRGDPAARQELGRKYLRGEDGIPRHVPTGLEYLTQPALSDSWHAAQVIAESLSLEEVVRYGQVSALRLAAEDGSSDARVKLALWLCISGGAASEAKTHLQNAAQAGHPGAPAALRALGKRSAPAALEGLLDAFESVAGMDPASVLQLAIADALSARDANRLSHALTVLLKRESESLDTQVADSMCAALLQAQHLPTFHLGEVGEQIEPLLEGCVWRGNLDAALILGLALCGISSGSLRPGSLAAVQNMRKGTALLLRAADSGKDEAWMHLYRVHSDQRVSVANPLMARFFLEKSAIGGNTLAQRMLGALILRSATTVHESEHGVHWLYEATRRGDLLAKHLLQSLVLQVEGSESEATAAIDAIERDDPWMAIRLRTARDFGLTKLEALSVDLVEGRRSWGLVVGPIPFVAQPRLAAPRAIPAMSPEAVDRLSRAAAVFERANRRTLVGKADIRKRQKRLRILLERHGADERWFFSSASATALHSLRSGPKWAFVAQDHLREALAS